MVPGFKKSDPAHTDFQYLEDLSCAYWYSEVLFAALELKIFMYIDKGAASLQSLAKEALCNESELFRLLRCMERMTLVVSYEDKWSNCQVSSMYLVPDKEAYMGDFFLYRHYMRPNWAKLSESVSSTKSIAPRELGYQERNFLYVKSMDTLVKQKAVEVAELIYTQNVNGPILDLGGGAGSMIRLLLTDQDNCDAVLFELPEVIEAAKELYPKESDWVGIKTLSGDFRTHKFDEVFGLIIMSNFLHAYGPDEAKDLLQKAVSLLGANGKIIIHDYFPDRRGANPQKGALYDLSMMLNTYNGACHEACVITQWLKECGLYNVQMADLSTDTSIIIADGDGKTKIQSEPLIDQALALGFDQAVPLNTKGIVTAPWVEMKCRYGCGGYGKNLQCPPHGMSYKKTRTLLDSYTRAILVQGAPPGKSFHDKLLALEKKAFLKGYPKAVVFGAGPCPVCPTCPEDGECRNHALARPSMESCGIDVYSTAQNLGLSLKPVKEKGQYIKYIGLLVLE
ncbi:MAG: DUF2284 domain-containing protein [Desulfobacula sp.]|nr:DUF2284 domain-containing protein [Desulfobacula sp.]